MLKFLKTIEALIDFLASGLTTIFALKIVKDLPILFILCIPFCQTFIPSLIFTFFQHPKQFLPDPKSGVDPGWQMEKAKIEKL